MLTESRPLVCQSSRFQGLLGTAGFVGGVVLALRHKGEGHGTVRDYGACDPRTALQLSHAAAQTPDVGLDLDDITGANRPPVARPINAGEHDQLFAVGRFRQDQNRTHLRNRFSENRRRQCRLLAQLARQVPLVERDILDADDPLIRL